MKKILLTDENLQRAEVWLGQLIRDAKELKVCSSERLRRELEEQELTARICLEILRERRKASV